MASPSSADDDFDSSYTDYKITKSPYGKDIVAQLSAAAKQADMPLGFYYSPPDLHHPAFRDTSKLATLVNDRIGVPGDYQTPEQFIPNAIPTKDVVISGVDPNIQDKLKPTVPKPEDFQLWETCMTINKTWAYNMHDHEYKSAQFLIRGLVEVASRGGNFLLNVGQQSDRMIKPEFQERLRAIGDWLTVNGESIYGTTYGPVQRMASARTTAKGKKVFIHVFDWPSSGLRLMGCKQK